jgi:hypothetical protein
MERIKNEKKEKEKMDNTEKKREACSERLGSGGDCNKKAKREEL